MSEEGQGPQTRATSRQKRRQPVFLLPGVVTAMVGLMVAIHLASTVALNQQGQLLLTFWFGFIPLRLFDSAGWLPLLWTPFTHAFLHAGFDHLLVNAAWFAIFATPVARRYGALATVAIFLASAAAGAAAFAATTLPAFHILIGASGGVAGLTGAAIRFIFQPIIVAPDPETDQPRVLGRRLATLGDVVRNPRSRFFFLFWVILNAAVPLVPLFTGAEVQIAWQAHLGGFFAGLLLVPLFEWRK